VELMIVVAILLILASLLVPAVRGVMTVVHRVACSSNLRQLGMAAVAYAGDHGDRLPAAEKRTPETVDGTPAWFCRLPGYLAARDVATGGRVFQCAAWAAAPTGTFTAASPKSLKWNARLADDGRPRCYRLGTWCDEAAVCLMADAKAGETGMGQWGHLVESGVDGTRHRGLVNVLCLDGHTLRAYRRTGGSDWAAVLTWVGGPGG
jgi:type II secretory pathway pseudopilin PulG